MPRNLGLTRNELEEYSELQASTGLTGEALNQKWLSRNTPDATCDGQHAWTAIQPIKVKPLVEPEEYPGEQLDLFLAVHELYDIGALKGPPGGVWPGSKYLPTERNKERIKHLMMLHQIQPHSRRTKRFTFWERKKTNVVVSKFWANKKQSDDAQQVIGG